MPRKGKGAMHMGRGVSVVSAAEPVFSCFVLFLVTKKGKMLDSGGGGEVSFLICFIPRAKS